MDKIGFRPKRTTKFSGILPSKITDDLAPGGMKIGICFFGLSLLQNENCGSAPMT